MGAAPTGPEERQPATAEELARRLDEGGRPEERAELTAALAELCRRDHQIRERYLLRFVGLLTDDAPSVRGEAAVGVLVCDEELRHLERVARLLDDDRPGVRLQAVNLLAPLGREELAPALTRRLDDDDPLVRVSAASSLCAGLGAGSAVGPRLRVLLEAVEHRLARFDALLALARARAPAAELPAARILTAWLGNHFDKVAAAAVLAALGKELGVVHLLRRARGSGPERPLAVELCGELGVPGASELLARISADLADPLRGTALRARAALGEPEGLAACERILRSETEDPDVRCDAAEGLLLAGAGREALEAAAAGQGEVAEVARAALELFGRTAPEIRLYLPLGGEPTT